MMQQFVWNQAVAGHLAMQLHSTGMPALDAVRNGKRLPDCWRGSGKAALRGPQGWPTSRAPVSGTAYGMHGSATQANVFHHEMAGRKHGHPPGIDGKVLSRHLILQMP